jgi:hypothetical protein
MNKRREMNRAKSGGKEPSYMATREPTHREPRYAGEGYAKDGSHGTASRTSGSPRHTEMVGPGPVPGAGQLPQPGPGPAAMRVRPSGEEIPTRSTPSGDTPRGMKTYAEGE